MQNSHFILFSLLLFVCSNSNAQLADNSFRPYEGDFLRFHNDFYDLGKLEYGDIVDFEIEFTNISDTVVYIDFISTCDCTDIDFPIHGISPNETSVLKVVFDSTRGEASETSDIDVFIKNKDPETGSQIYYTLEFTYKIVN
jgi:hypothetical protein